MDNVGNHVDVQDSFSNRGTPLVNCWQLENRCIKLEAELREPVTETSCFLVFGFGF